MPITSISRVPFGRLPAAQDVEPRTNILSSVPQAMETTAQREQNAALTSFRAASAVGDVGREVAAMGLEFLKPLDQLNKARKVLQANDISINAMLTARRMADVARTNGTPSDEYYTVVAAEYERITAGALHQARRLGPAAVERVATDLGNEKIRLFTSAQQYTIERGVDARLGELQRTDTFLRQEVLRTPHEHERVALMARYDDAFDTAAQQGVIKAADAETRKQDFHHHVIKNTAIQIGRLPGGVLAAREYIRKSGVSPTHQAAFENAVVNDLSYDESQKQKAEKVVTREIQIAQSQVYGKLVDETFSTSDPVRLEAIRRQSQKLLEDRQITGEQSSQINRWAANRIDELLKPVKPVDDARVKQAIVVAIGTRPQEVTPDIIMGTDGLTTDTRLELWRAWRSTQSERHYTKNPLYLSRIRQFDEMKTPNKQHQPINPEAILDQKTGAQPEDLGTIVEDHKAQYILRLEEKFKSKNGIATNEDILAEDAYFETLRTSIRDPNRKAPKSSPNAASAPSFSGVPR